MLEICECTAFPCLQKDSLCNVSTIVTDTEIPTLGRFKSDDCTFFCTDTSTNITAFRLEIPTAVVSVTDAPALFYKSGKRCQSQPLQCIEIEVIISCIFDILPFPVIT